MNRRRISCRMKKQRNLNKRMMLFTGYRIDQANLGRYCPVSCYWTLIRTTCLAGKQQSCRKKAANDVRMDQRDEIDCNVLVRIVCNWTARGGRNPEINTKSAPDVQSKSDNMLQMLRDSSGARYGSMQSMSRLIGDSGENHVYSTKQAKGVV